MPTIVFKLSLRHILFTFLVCAIFLPIAASAESVSYNFNLFNTTLFNTPFRQDWDKIPQKALDGIGGSVTYGATITRVSTGTLVRGEGKVSPGEELILKFKPHFYKDIVWYGIGYSFDTPYGEWLPRGETPRRECNQKDFVNFFDTLYGEHVSIFIPLAVVPPPKRIESLEGLECGPLETVGDSLQRPCTVKEGFDKLNPTFVFGNSVGHFFYRVLNRYTVGVCEIPDNTFVLPENKYGDDWPLLKKDSSKPYSIFMLEVPEQRIQYNLTVKQDKDDDNKPPTPPTISVEATACHKYSVTVKSTDPDGDDIKFSFDWNNNGHVDELLPPSGYVPSGTSQSTSRFWKHGEKQMVKVMAEDKLGNPSVWVTKEFNVSDEGLCDFSVNLTAKPSTITLGQTTALAWDTEPKADSCSLYEVLNSANRTIVPKAGGKGTRNERPSTEGTHTYKAICTDDADGKAFDMVDVVVQAPKCEPGPWICDGQNDKTNGCTTVPCSNCQNSQTGPICAIPVTGTITVDPARVRKGNTTTVAWTTNPAGDDCSVVGDASGTWTGPVGSKTSSPISSETTYTLSCTNLPVPVKATVRIVPDIIEI